MQSQFLQSKYYSLLCKTQAPFALDVKMNAKVSCLMRYSHYLKPV